MLRSIEAGRCDFDLMNTAWMADEYILTCASRT